MSARFTWTDRHVRDALGLPPASADPRRSFTGISTDTRSLQPGDLFVALRGDRYDAHEFLGAAEAAGAAALVVSADPMGRSELPTYRVPDTLEALGRLARHRRRALPARVVGLTGSTGKTTVKELLSAALGASFRVDATRGNLNNRVGVPLSLLSAPEEAEYLVIEMGTSEPGEIRTLAAIAEPDHGLVTTVSEAHLEGLGSLEGVMDEKLDLIRGTGPTGAVLVGDDPPVLTEAARRARPDVHVAGLSARADGECRGRLLDQDHAGRYSVRFHDREIRAGIPGRHGAWNLVVALAMSSLLGADEERAAENASQVGAGRLRGEIRKAGSVTLLLDCYNANPQSVRAALTLLSGLPGSGAKVAVLGSMLELGERSVELHSEVLDVARELDLDLVVATGQFAIAAERRSSEGVPIVRAEGVEAAYEAALPRIPHGARVLLKGSRGVALETLVARFESDFDEGGEGGAG